MIKQNKWIMLVVAVLLLSAMMAGCHADTEAPTFGNGPQEVTAANEQELRELLAREDAELLISLSNDIQVKKGFVVNGTKTLAGDAELKMDMSSELGQSLLQVSADSTLTLNGPVLECSYNADGILVDVGGELNCLSGTVKHAGAYGIVTYGKVNIEDIHIEDSMYISICGQTGSEVYMNGGSIVRSAYNHVYLVAGAYMKISGNTVMEGSFEQGLINYGTLEIHDGKFGETYGYLCDNYGVLNVEYKGTQENGYIEVVGSRKSAFLSRLGSTTNISDVYIRDTKRQGISSLGGETVITHCKIENTGGHALDIQKGEATITDVVVTDVKASGLETKADVKVTVSNFTVDGCGNIGIACRGAEIIANQITIRNTEKYGMSCGDSVNSHGRLIVKDATLSGTAKQGVYLYDKGRGEFENIEITDGASRGIIVKTTATAQITGNSVIKNMALGGVEVHGTLTADSLTVCNNNSANSGAGVYVGAGGNVTLNNGAIYNNRSAVRGGGVCVTDGTIIIAGTKIYGNSAAKHGGGMYVQKYANVSLKSGQITNNHSDSYGDGIYILSAESQVKIAANFYLGGNDIKVDNTEAIVKFTGSSMVYHSEKDPVLLTPSYDAPEGTVLAICNSESNAKNIAVASGDGSYELVQDGKNFAIRYAKADMDMTGADTVYVSTFAQLKKAVEGTTSKRNIILTGDIEFTERIRLPGGVTINIQDDGTQRTLTRAEGFTNSFFVTHYGTGLYLSGTEAEKLVIDGGYTAENDATTLQPLIRVAGSTVLTNVVLQNNGSLTAKTAVNGALFRNCNGDFKICNSVLTGGRAYSGGAVIVEKGAGRIENTVIKGNQSAFSGAGIRVQGSAQLEILDSVFETNHAGSAGGGICVSNAAQVTVTNTKFDRNTAVERGGAISAQDEGTVLSLVGSDGESAVIKNNRSEIAGAVYAVSKAHLEVTGYLFEKNAAVEDENTEKSARAGAVCVIGDSSAVIAECRFYGNKADASGGAIAVDAGKTVIHNCAFESNEAGDKAGAILVNAGGTVKMTAEQAATYNSVKNNTANGVGGVFYVNEDSSLEIENYTFEGNQGAAGGAIYVRSGCTVVSGNNQFMQNKAVSGGTYGNGGAVFCEGSYTDTNSSYCANEARNGGAVIVMKGGVAALDGAGNGVMQGNVAKVNGGSAVYVNTGADATVTGYLFKENTGENGGTIQVHTSGKLALSNAVFGGDDAAKVYVLGSLDIHNITNVSLVAASEKSAFVISGYESGNAIAFTPFAYKSKVVFQKAEGLAEETFRAACKAIAVTQIAEDVVWKIDETGKLISTQKVPAVATITVSGQTVEFATLQAAVDYANANGSTETMEIVLLKNASIAGTVQIQKNIAIVNLSGKEITISRGTDMASDMFSVNEGAALTLGISETAETGKLIIDGTSEAAIAARTVTVASGAAFTLNKNATLQNANSTVAGAAVHTSDADAFVYGTIQNNVTTDSAGAMYVAKNAGATISGAIITNNQGIKGTGGVYIGAGAIVNCQNATFSYNKAAASSNAGAIYVAGSFTDTNSSYIGNEAKNGGAIFAFAGAEITLTGTDSRAVFQNNKATGAYGGAIYLNNSGKKGSSANIQGYTFENNTGTTDPNSAIYVKGYSSVTLENVIFQGQTAQTLYVAANGILNDETKTSNYTKEYPATVAD